MPFGVPAMIGMLGCAALTTIENGGRAAVAVPSLTEIAMEAYVPICAPPGVPASMPVDVLKVAQTGQLAMA